MPKTRKKAQLKRVSAVSELRRDLVTGDWIVIAKKRAKRPHAYISESADAGAQPKEGCPFEDPQKFGNAKPLLVYRDTTSKDWVLQVIPNKYPAFAQIGDYITPRKRGPYEVIDGRGYHEVIITRDHTKHLALFTKREAASLIRAYQERFQVFREDECVTYISVFHNHGRAAGATLSHPHSQLIAIPVVPADVRRSLSGSATYFHEMGKCVHCTTLEWEQEDHTRVIFENDSFIAFCPFISRAAFEVRIFPKKHQSKFDQLPPELYGDLGDALRISLWRLYNTLKNPPYNFFLHTAPLDGKDYPHYHWHIEILPKTAIWAGFELGTGIEISTLTPEQAAKFLREVR